MSNASDHLGTSFPPVEERLLRDWAPCDDVLDFLRRAEDWRARVRDALADEGQTMPISQRMTTMLLASLRAPHVPSSELQPASVYGVAPYPAPPRAFGLARNDADCAMDRQFLLDILVWRSRLVDFLSDVWDVMGTPLLEMEECEWVIREVLTPAGAVDRCVNCLLPVPPGNAERSHFDQCIVRIARNAVS